MNNVKTILLNRDGAQCSICGKALTNENICIDHIFPRGLGGSDNLDNLRLLCRECNCKYVNVAFNDIEFERYIYDIIQKNSEFRNVRLEERMGRDYKIGIAAERKVKEKWEKLAIEVEYSTSFTIARVNWVVAVSYTHLIKISGNYITSVKKIDAVTKNFIAVEAKISDWKAGLEQAVRYKQYANEVYVALSSEYVQKVERQQYRDLNIGLMSVSAGKLKISIRAKKQPVEKLDIQYYIADRFLKQLKLSEMLE